MSLIRRITALLHPGREHTAASAVGLLMFATLLARVVGALRDVYVAAAFGAGPLTDAYIAAFTLPDFLLYLFAGGSISITFISLYGRRIAAGAEAEAEEAFSIIITTLVLAFTVVAILGALFAPWFTAHWFHGFTPEQAALCVRLTRLLMPQPVFFLIGGVLSAVLQTRRKFLIPALAPLVYTLAIILGGILLKSREGIAGLAIGATAGAALGPFLLNAVGAASAKIRYRPSLNIAHPAFREWLRLSIPLMLGVSVVAADDWIMRYFASGAAGEITLLNNAKRLLQLPIGVFGQAAGIAALPFFAALWGAGKSKEFAAAVNGAVTRLAAVCLLVTGWFAIAAPALTDLYLRRGKFSLADSRLTAHHFAAFAPALVLWAVQGLYARGFYGAGDMIRPMVAGTLITLLSIPVYGFCFHHWQIAGLIAASDLAILTHTVVLAVMLDRKGWVPLNGLDWPELGKCLAAALAGGGAGLLALRITPYLGTRRSAVAALLGVTVAWLWAAGAVLWAANARLPRELWEKITAKVQS